MGIGRLSPAEVGTWATTLVLVLAVLVAVSYRQRLPVGRAIVLCGLLLAVPLVDFLLSWDTFVSGGASPTVQLSIPAEDLWSRWVGLWPVLLQASLVNLAVPPVVFTVWCRRAKRWSWSVALLCGMAEVAGLLSIRGVIANFPSA